MMTGTARKNSTTSQHGQRSQPVLGELAHAEDHAEDDGAEHGEDGHLHGVERPSTRIASMYWA